jgi:hypothetical protein
MNCRRCLKMADCSLHHFGPLCKGCFSELIEKRVRKYIRLHDFFKKNDSILVAGDVSCHFIKRIMPELPMDIQRVSINYKKTSKKRLFIDYTLDDEINDFLNRMFSKKTPKKNVYSIIKVLTDEEAETYSKFHGTMFKKNRKKKHVQEFIDGLERVYPEIKFSLAKSIDELKDYM